jgi:hypothetical protein
MWRPVAIKATPQGGQDQGAVQHSCQGKGSAQLQAAAAGARQEGGAVCVSLCVGEGG